ncbi:hypothetical protein LTR27_005223 [Elasticomyces elasticus]|nr:hypothetical protein LTR27_005223 [Elasticomyces elasticus]
MMASHIACEASRQGLEAQIAALHKGYGDEITRLQGLLNAPPEEHKQQMPQLQSLLAAQAATYGQETSRLKAQIDNIKNKSSSHVDELTKQHDTRIAQLEAQHFEQIERLKAEQELDRNNYMQTANIESAELKQQARQLQEQNAQLTARLNEEKTAHESTKHSMSTSISQIRTANRVKITELESRLETLHKPVKSDPKAFFKLKLRSTMYTQELEYRPRGTAKLSNLASRLSKDVPTLNNDNVSFFLPCKSHFAPRALQDHDMTLSQLGVVEGDTIIYANKARGLPRPECDCNQKRILDGDRAGFADTTMA